MKDFSMIESLENWVTWHYLRKVIGLTLDKVAYEMNVNETRLREWLNKRTKEMDKLATKQPEKVKQIIVQLEKKYPQVKVEETTPLKININKVVECLKNGDRIPDIERKFKVDSVGLRSWLQENRAIINQKMKQ